MGFSVSFGSRAPLLLKTKTKENVNTNYQKWRQLLTTQKKMQCNFHRAYYLIRFLKTWTIKSVLDFWKRIMSGIVSQDQQKRKNTLWDSDEYPILCSSDQYLVKHRRREMTGWTNTQYSSCTLILGAKGKKWGLTRPRIFFGGKRTNSNLLLLEGSYTRIFNIAVRIPVPWHSRGYPILPDFRNCLFLVHMNHAALNFVLSISADFREPFVHIFSAIWSDDSLCSFVENSFAVSVMTTWRPCRWSW